MDVICLELEEVVIAKGLAPIRKHRIRSCVGPSVILYARGSKDNNCPFR